MRSNKKVIAVMSIAAGCLTGEFSATGMSDRLLPIVEVEEQVYDFKPANNGAGPLWGNASTCIVRLGDKVFVSGLETLENQVPLNNVRWLLFERGPRGWDRLQAAGRDDRTREPCPLACFQDGRLLLSVNPTLTPVGTRNGPAQPRVLEFSATNPRRPSRTLLPAWDGSPAFTEHSYRSFAADGLNHELILFQNVGYDHAEWAFFDRSGQWSAGGKLVFPWGAEYEKPKPVRVCYPAVALRDRSVYWFGVSDVTEPNSAWRAYKKKLTGRDWDYDFRRLFFTWCPDITRGEFHPWIEVASREKTCGWLFPCDLWVAPDGAVHLLWSERAIDERLRKEFFPDAKQSWSLNHAIVRDGKVVRRGPLAIGGEGRSSETPGKGRFQVTPDNRLFVFYYCGGRDTDGRAVSENRVVEVYPDGSHGATIRVPLEYPFTAFINATVRAGCSPHDTLDVLGQAPGRPGMSYARISLLHDVRPEPRVVTERRSRGVCLHLDGSHSLAAQDGITSWKWDLDGAVLDGEKVDCELRKSGNVSLALTVSDARGHRNTVRRILRLPPVPGDFGLSKWGLVLRTEAEAYAHQTGGSVRIESGLRGASALAVTDWNESGHTLDWAVDFPSTDRYWAVLHYSAPAPAVRNITIDGERVCTVHFAATGGYSTPHVDAWGYATPRDTDGHAVPLLLEKGPHSVRIEAPDDSALALDYIDWIARDGTPHASAGTSFQASTDGQYPYLLSLKGTIRPTDVRSERGHCFITRLGPNYPGDGLKGHPPSALRLYENGKPLGPAHVAHKDIRSRGEGRYAHWKTSLYFSTSDNSDPRTNGRTYTWRILPAEDK